MEIGIGKMVKWFREKMNLTQSELAEGIISVSYLSRIENGLTEPSKQILELLSKKLNIDSFSDENDKITKLCKQWFRTLLTGRIEEAKNLYIQVNEYKDYISQSNLNNILELHRLQYFIITDNTKSAEEQFIFLKKNAHKFKGNEKYYWFKFSGNYYYYLYSYNEALSCYQNSEKELHRELLFRDIEEADIYYCIALTASKLKKVYICYLYGNKALEIYQKVYNLKRCVECHILLGMSFHGMNLKVKAMDSFKLGIEISESITDDAQLLSACYQNIGELYSSMNLSNLAIKYFKKNYNLINNNKEMIIVPVLSLIKEYFNLKDIPNIQKWMKKGINLIESQHQIDPIFKYELQVFYYLTEGPDDSLEELLTKKAIPYFDKKKLYYEKYLYLSILGDYYFSKRKYKSAALCYQRSTDSFKNVFVN